MPKSIGRKGIIAIVLALIAVIGVASLAFFTDRVDHSMQFTTASFSADGYELTRTAPEGPFCAGEEVTATLKESNTGDDDVNSIISMKATWVSPDTTLSIFGNANAADNAKLSIDGTDISYKVSTDKKSITFDLPKQVLAAGTKDAARDLTLTIPASFKSTGRIEFTFEKVVVAQEGGGFSKEYSRTDLNAASDLDYSVKVGWAASSIEAQNGKALMGYLTDKNSSGKFGIEFELAFNYTESPMKDFSSRTGAKWSYYKGAVDLLTFVEGMTTIGDYAFPDFSAVKSVSFPTTVKTIGLSAFDASGLTGTVTIPATVKEIKSLAFGNLPNAKTFTFGHTTDSLTLPDNTAAGKRNTGAFYVPTHVDTTVNTTVEAIMYGYKWHDGYDNRRLVPTLNAQDTWFRTYTSGSNYTAKLDEDVLETITFADYHMPVTGETSWDASDPSVPGTVTAFLSADKKSLILAGNGYGLIFANEDSSGAFGNLTALKTVSNTDLLDTRNATTMADMFNFDKKLANISVTTWNVSKVTYMSNMFYCCDSLPSIDLKPNTCTAKDGSGQYTAWNTASLKNTSGMFMDYGGENHALTTVNTTGWNTSKLEDTSYMFMECRGLTAVKGIESWNVSGLKDAHNMFQDCQSLQTINVSNWNTASLENTSVMFSSCHSLRSIDITKWDMSKVTKSNAMFSYCKSFTELTLPKSLTVIGSYFAGNCPKLTTITFNHPAGTEIQFSSEAFYIYNNDKAESEAGYIEYTPVNPLGTKVVTSNAQVLEYDWTSDHRGYVVEIKTVEGGTLTGTPLAAHNGRKAVVAINGKTITFADTAEEAYAYDGATVQYSQGGTAKTVTLDKNTKTWVMPVVDDKVTEADVVVTPKWKVTALPMLAKEDTWQYNGTDTNGDPTTPIDYDLLETINIVNKYTPAAGETSWDASANQTVDGVEYKGKVTVYLSADKKTLTISGNGYGKVFANPDSMWAMTKAYDGMSALKQISGANILDTQLVVNAGGMFAQNRKLESVDVSNWNTGNIQNTSAAGGYYGMFMNCAKLKSLNVSNWNTKSVTEMSRMFSGCSLLSTIDVSKWNTSSCVYMNDMFYGAGISQIDMTGWNTGNLKYTYNMFKECANLTGIDLSTWDESIVNSAYDMFRDCKALTSVNLNGWNLSNLEDGTTDSRKGSAGMFSGCTALTELNIPASLKVFGQNFAANCTSLNKITFLHDAGTVLTFPTAGATYGAFYVDPAMRTTQIVGQNTSAKAYSWVKDQRAAIPTLAAQKTWYKGTTAKSAITGIEIVDSYSGASTESWDASAAQDGSVKAYINGTKLIIAGNGYGKVLANADSTSAFNAFTNVTSFTGLNKLDTSNVTNMQTMFNNLDNIQTLDLSSFNTSRVTNFYSIFGGNDKLTTLNLTGWDTSAAKDMGQMFYVCNALTTINGLSSFNTANVTDMSGMFHGCKAMTSLDLSNFNTAKVKTLSMMFYQCSNLETVKLTSFDTSNVTSLYAMFQYCYKLKAADLSSFNTAKVTNMRSIFGSCKAIESLDLSSFDTSAVTNMSAAFDGCQTLQTVTLGKDFKFVGTDGYLPAPSATYISGADGNWYVAGTDTGYTPTELAAVTRVRNVTYSAVKPETVGGLDVGESVFLNVDGKRMEFIVVNQGNPDTSIYDDSCNGTWLLMKDIYEKRQWSSSNVNNLENSTIHSYLNGTFLNLFDSNIKDTIKQVKIPYRKNGGSGGTDQSGANGLSAKIFLLSGYEVGWTTSDDSTLPMDGAKLDYFESGTGTYANSKRIANFNGAAAIWVLRSPLTSVTGSVWGVYSDGSSTYFSAADSRDGGRGVRPALVLPSTITVDNDRNVGGSTGGGGGDIPADLNLAVPEQVGTLTANGSEQSPTWKNYDSSKMTISGTTSAVEAGTYTVTFTLNDGYAWFDGTAEDKDVQWTMESGGPMLAESNTWYKSTKVTSNNQFKTIAIINSGKPSGTIVEQWNADVDNSGSIKAYITGSSGSYTLTIAGNGSGSIMANPNSSLMFTPTDGYDHEFSAVTSISGLGLLDTSNVTNIGGMFKGCGSLTSLDLSGFDTSSATDMSSMFFYCKALTALDVSKFDTSNVTSMRAMFDECGALTSLNLSGFDTSKVTDMSGMFLGCKALTSLDLSGWDTSKVTNMREMFYNCSALTALDLSGFDTSNVINIADMFYLCSALTSLDVSGFDTSQVTSMRNMFSNCSALTSLDLSGFDTSKVTTMGNMFSNCTKLKSVTLGKAFKFVGTDGYLPTPSSTYITGADGKWYDTNTGTGYTPEALASVERTKAVTYSAVPNAKILSGMWKFNKGLGLSRYDINANVPFKSAGKTFSSIYVPSKTTNLCFDGKNTYLEGTGWTDAAYRLISFNGSHVVTEDFYNWFVENAKPVVTLEGKWKFNETLTFDTEVQATEISYTINGGTGTILYTSYDESGKWPGWKLGVDANIFPDVWVYGDTGSGLTPLGWRDESYRTIAFNGTQYVTKDFYDWFIANAKPWSEDESGAAEKIAVPKQSGTLTYNGSAQSPSWSSYDASKMTIGGTTTGTNAGSYTTTFALNDGFKWADGTTGTKSVIWKIGKATGSVSFSKDSLNIDKNSTTDTLDVTRTGTGAITATSSDTSVATVTVNGTKVTVTKVGDGTATITIKVAADANYKEASKTCSVTCVGIPTLAYGSTWYKGSTDKASITKIQIKDSYTPSGTAAESWNADARNSGSIKAYVEGTTLTIAGNGTGKIKANALSWSVFNGFSSATAITGLDLMDTSNALTMEAMFYGCKALTALDVSKFDTSNVTSMRAMFYECENLTSLNVSKFDTAAVTNVEAMFQGCKALTAVGDVSGWNTAKVTSMYQVFYGCEKLAALDLSGWNTINVTNMQAMFLDCTSLTSVGDLSGWNTAKVTEMALLFGNCEKLASLDVSKFNTAAVTNMNAMFFNCSALTTLDVSSFDTAKTTNLAAMFSGCVSLTSLDVSNWNTSNVTNMQAMFLDCTSLTSVGDLSGWNTAKVTEMALLFGNCEKLASLDVSKFNTAAVTNMNAMFFNCSALTTLDVSSFDTAKTTNLAAMFSGCVSLTSLDVSNWNTSNVTTMEATFQSCKKLTTMGDVSGWDTSKVTNMREMFCQCNLITSVDVTNWKTGNVTNMNGIFSNCEKLTSVGDLSGWDTSSATDMGLIFNSCFKLTGMGDISQWDTSNATKMNCLFATCESLTELDLSGWDTSKVTDMNNIFGGYEHEQLEEGEIAGACVLLRKITLGAKFKFVGTDSYLPEPDSRYISGADGKWYAGSTGYTPAELAGLSRTEAVTYVAVKGTKTMSILSGDNAVSGYSISE